MKKVTLKINVYAKEDVCYGTIDGDGTAYIRCSKCDEHAFWLNNICYDNDLEPDMLKINLNEDHLNDELCGFYLINNTEIKSFCTDCVKRLSEKE